MEAISRESRPTSIRPLSYLVWQNETTSWWMSIIWSRQTLCSLDSNIPLDLFLSLWQTTPRRKRPPWLSRLCSNTPEELPLKPSGGDSCRLWPTTHLVGPSSLEYQLASSLSLATRRNLG